MAVEKRARDQPCSDPRNVRARLFYQLHPQAPNTSPILRRKNRLRYTKSPPLSPIHTKENIDDVPNGSTVKVTTLPCKNRIRFFNKVYVVRIPSRDQYPDSIKKTIWGNLREISENARRNSIEFAAEGWDWRRAIEDDEMYVDPSGDRIHPVHVNRDFRPPFIRKHADV
jgi:hypothetical protein